MLLVLASMATSTSQLQSGTYEVHECGAQIRRYEVPHCGKNYSLAALHYSFAAHAVEWNIMGRDKPWWSVITSDEFKSKHPSRKALTNFYLSGAEHVDRVLSDLGMPRSALASKDVLDFGCGLGRLALTFAQHGARVACADQSVHHLALAQQTLPTLDQTAAARVRYVVTTPDLIASVQGSESFDVVHSVIVLQHTVSPLQAALMQQMCDVLRPGGVGWVQVPYMVPTIATGCDLDRWVRVGGMQMHATPMSGIQHAFSTRGCRATVRDGGGAYVDASPNPTHKSAIVTFSKPGPSSRRKGGRAAREGVFG
jgi:SAM-dependent methyltransferase